MNRYMIPKEVHTDLMSSWLPHLASLTIDRSLLLGVFPTVRRTDRAFGLSRLTNLQVLQHSGGGSIILGPDIGHFTRLSRIVVGLFIDLQDTTVWGNITRLTRLTHLVLPLQSTANRLEVYELPPDLGKLTALTLLEIWWPKTHTLTLPSSIGLLTKLRTLKIAQKSYNARGLTAKKGQQLKFRDEDALFKLKLDDLYLWIPAVLPSAIGRLSTLTRLTLMINATVLPDQIGMLSNLTYLMVNGNHLRYVVCVFMCCVCFGNRRGDTCRCACFRLYRVVKVISSPTICKRSGFSAHRRANRHKLSPCAFSLHLFFV